MIDKKDYILKTLSNTKNKNFENYVINRLYTRLNDLDIKPMTQKYVKRQKGYALIDLYFPQFNIGIECDEIYHSQQIEMDSLRTEDIVTELKNYGEHRIKESFNLLSEINISIDNVVEVLKNEKNRQLQNKTFRKWQILSPEEYFKNKEKITIYDDIEFNTICEASNLIFNTCYKGQQKSYFKIKTTNSNIRAWFPQLAIEKNGTMVASSSGWNNTINDNKDTIIEYNEFVDNTDNSFDKMERVTFMKIKNKITNKSNYKFLGVFKPISKIDGKVTYKRISTEFEIIT